MITYKVFTPENIVDFLNNEKLLKESYLLVNQNILQVKEYEKARLNFFKKDLKNENTFVFLSFSENKLIGFLSGYTNLDNFNILSLFISPKHHSKAIGTKLKIYSMAYLRSKKGINNFASLNVVNPKIYAINKRIVDRKSLSKTSYSFEKISKDGFSKNNLKKIVSKKRR